MLTLALVAGIAAFFGAIFGVLISFGLSVLLERF